jgi:hypothetical protein
LGNHELFALRDVAAPEDGRTPLGMRVDESRLS